MQLISDTGVEWIFIGQWLFFAIIIWGVTRHIKKNGSKTE